MFFVENFLFSLALMLVEKKDNHLGGFGGEFLK